MEDPNALLLSKNVILKERWEVHHKIGQGAFGQTFMAVDHHSNEQVAIKAESCTSKKQVLKVEVSLLRKLQGSPNVARYVACGRQEGVNFIVMQLLGKNISELRRKQPNHMFSVSTTCLLLKQMLEAVKSIHDIGYLHRDVKPSNFVMGLKRTSSSAPSYGRPACYIIDFGLSRRHLNKNDVVREARDVAGFRGTARYAALTAHQSKELGRKDDLWSIFYIMLEFLSGGLPWRKEKDKDIIGKMKQQHHNASLVRNVPVCCQEWMAYLDKLSYADRPDYDYLSRSLDALFDTTGDPPDIPYDWEKDLYQVQPAIPSNHFQKTTELKGSASQGHVFQVSQMGRSTAGGAFLDNSTHDMSRPTATAMRSMFGTEYNDPTTMHQLLLTGDGKRLMTNRSEMTLRTLETENSGLNPGTPEFEERRRKGKANETAKEPGFLRRLADKLNFGNGSSQSPSSKNERGSPAYSSQPLTPPRAGQSSKLAYYDSRPPIILTESSPNLGHLGSAMPKSAPVSNQRIYNRSASGANMHRASSREDSSQFDHSRGASSHHVRGQTDGFDLPSDRVNWNAGGSHSSRLPGAQSSPDIRHQADNGDELSKSRRRIPQASSLLKIFTPKPPEDSPPKKRTFTRFKRFRKKN